MATIDTISAAVGFYLVSGEKTVTPFFLSRARADKNLTKNDKLMQKPVAEINSTSAKIGGAPSARHMRNSDAANAAKHRKAVSAQTTIFLSSGCLYLDT